MNGDNGYNLIFSGGARGAVNMAEDLHILNRYRHLDDFTVRPTLRLYFFSPPALSLGFFQNKLDGELIKRAKSQGYDIVRRPTGGRAVLHLNEITYSVAASYKSGIFSGRLMETYKIISDFLYNFFLKIGLNPDSRVQNVVNSNSSENVGNAENNNKNFNCFLKAHSYEITFSGKKICGNSQRRNDTAFLQHGSIYINYNPEEHCELFENNCGNNNNEEVNIDKTDEDKNELNICLESKKEYNQIKAKDYKDYAGKITGIKQELLKKNACDSKDPKKQIDYDYGTLLDKNKLLSVLKTSFEETYNLKSIDYKFKDTEISEIARLAETVFIA